MVYIETNTFTFNATGNPAYFWGTSAVQSYYGARTVFRYNTLNNAQVDQHGTCGSIGARWWEIYNNTFNVVVNGNQSTYMALRDGAGVVFNNHVSDPQNNGGAGSIELTEDCTSGTYPSELPNRSRNQRGDIVQPMFGEMIQPCLSIVVVPLLCRVAITSFPPQNQQSATPGTHYGQFRHDL